MTFRGAKYTVEEQVAEGSESPSHTMWDMDLMPSKVRYFVFYQRLNKNPNLAHCLATARACGLYNSALKSLPATLIVGNKQYRFFFWGGGGCLFLINS